MTCQEGQCLPEDMVLVPAGQFHRGCNEGLDMNCLSNEKPGHLVFLEAFLVDRTEVPASRYQACVDAGACFAPEDASYDPASKPNHPATGVTYEQATAYCGWMDRRLPSEAEWEKAARGGCELSMNCSAQAKLYPWGNTAPSCATAWYSACTATAATRPVGTLPDGASPYGALDMAGNAAEWVADWYLGLYEVEYNSNPTGPDFGTYRSIRGGNSGTSNGAAGKMRVSWRGSDVPHMTWTGTSKGQLGFRCALSFGDL
jgi:formylglycine-generating enzyme required for sulfatase activity